MVKFLFKQHIYTHTTLSLTLSNPFLSILTFYTFFLSIVEKDKVNELTKIHSDIEATNEKIKSIIKNQKLLRGNSAAVAVQEGGGGEGEGRIESM